MKTSVIEVRDLLSVLTVDEVEKRIEDVAGVESATVNYDAKNATVRHDEILLEVADIKVLIHQRGQQSPGESQAKDVGKEKSEHKSEEKPEQNPGAKSTPEAALATAAAAPKPTNTLGDGQPDKAGPNVRPSIPVATEPKPPANDSAVTPAAPPADEHEDHQEPGALGKFTAWVRDTFAGDDKDPAEPGAQAATPGATDAKTSPDPPATGPKTAPTAPAADKHAGHKKPDTQSSMSAEMAHEMGHGGGDLAAMVRDMRNRFWICLFFTIPIFIYAPMGEFFKPPSPPFGIELNLWLFFLASAAILYPSWPFFVSAWRAIRKGVLGMAALIVLSVGTGYIFSVGNTFFFKDGGQFFEAVSVLLVFILLGHWLEMHARAGASSAIKALMNLTPTKASVIRNGVESQVPTAEVLAGETKRLPSPPCRGLPACDLSIPNVPPNSSIEFLPFV